MTFEKTLKTIWSLPDDYYIEMDWEDGSAMWVISNRGKWSNDWCLYVIVKSNEVYYRKYAAGNFTDIDIYEFLEFIGSGLED